MKNVSVGIIVRNGLVLACQRLANARYPLKWEFPGGKVEKGEAFEEALVRELREELSIEATIKKEFHRQEWTYGESTSPENSTGAFHVRYFLVGKFTGTPTNNAFERIKWVTPSSLLEMEILEGNRRSIELLMDEVNLSSNESEEAA